MELVLIDTTGIQPYIFGSNRLRENVGASHLVAEATTTWVYETLPDSCNLSNRATGAVNPALRLEEDGRLVAELIYAGGGNAAVLFRDAAPARRFIHALTSRVLRDAPGLQVVAHRASFDWNTEALATTVMDRAQAALAAKKQTRPRSAALLGLGVTKRCRATGLPAAGFADALLPEGDTEPYPASLDILAKIAATRDLDDRRRPGPAVARLNAYCPPPPGFDYPLDFDHLGRAKGEQSYLAVVHADGDGMGKRVQALAARHDAPGPENRAYIQALRAFSRAVDNAAREALEATVKDLRHIIQQAGKEAYIEHGGPQRRAIRIDLDRDKESGLFDLPFRPLVFGGDDLAFVCDGRLGLSLAVTYCRHFKAASANALSAQDTLADTTPLTASAGVAVVKVHYPFARAYRLADALAGKAKKYRTELDEKADTDRPISCIDWHFALGGLLGDLDTIRAVHYTPDDLKDGDTLLLRPLTIGENPLPSHEHQAWPRFSEVVGKFQGPDGDWAEKRSKMKDLRDALRQGPNAVKKYLEGIGAHLPAVDPSRSYVTTGWEGGLCLYFDVLEMVDWFIPLDTQPELT